jgi:hypothetical protein
MLLLLAHVSELFKVPIISDLVNDNLWWAIPRDLPLHLLVTLSLLSLLLELQTLFIHQLDLLSIHLL